MKSLDWIHESRFSTLYWIEWQLWLQTETWNWDSFSLFGERDWGERGLPNHERFDNRGESPPWDSFASPCILKLFSIYLHLSRVIPRGISLQKTSYTFGKNPFVFKKNPSKIRMNPFVLKNLVRFSDEWSDLRVIRYLLSMVGVFSGS